MKKLLDSSGWTRVPQNDFAPILARYRRTLENASLKQSTIESYIVRVNAFLEFAQSDTPEITAFEEFRQYLFDKKLTRSAINNSSFAIKWFYAMIGKNVSFEFIKPHDIIPYFFNQEDVSRILESCRNIKHRAMFEILFFACLRASELCNLDIDDIDLETLTLRLKESKNGTRNETAYMNHICANTLKQYLRIRPSIEIDNRKPLFFTDYGKRWDHKGLYRLFMDIKKRAGITKPGAVHVFSRHTTATLMINRGCDIRIVQKILRHNDIRTTLRYAHVSDKTQREAYEKFLTL